MATLKEQLQADLTTSMKARDEATTATLRMVLAAITNVEVAGDEAKALSDSETLGVLRSEAKKRAEAAEIFAGAGREERAEAERSELAIIERYLPAAMPDDELRTVVAAAVAEAAANGATGPKAMGGVIKAVREQVGDRADGGRISAMVKAALV
ncbi:MAG: GatB/YqeY domain-containing protein [Ilumatobacteraceae bacterium]